MTRRVAATKRVRASVPSAFDRLGATVPNLTDNAYAVIKGRLIYLEMPPGMSFTEGSLAADLGISKTPVREALAWLRREGLVEASVRTGYRVAPVTLRDARDLFALRVLLEGEAASLAARQMADPRHLITLDQLCKASYNPADSRSIKTYMRKNTEFHVTVARASGNNFLATALMEVLDKMERLFHIGLHFTSRADEIVHEHTELVEAIVSGNEAAAREAVVSQVRASQRMVLDALLASPYLLATNVMGDGPPASGSGLKVGAAKRGRKSR